jgi:hypothetical protein
MSIRDVLLPLFVQVILTVVLLFSMAALRTRSFAQGLKPADIALRQPNWPPDVTKVANAFHNQLEVPLLFYVLTILAWDTHHAGTLLVTLAWLFVVLRIIHAVIHVTTNHVRQRGLAYIAGVIVLALMWAIYMMDILLGT